MGTRTIVICDGCGQEGAKLEYDLTGQVEYGDALGNRKIEVCSRDCAGKAMDNLVREVPFQRIAITILKRKVGG